MATLVNMMACTPIKATTNESELIGSSTGLRRVWNSVQMVARTDSAVLIQGETGTGKELIARAIHDESLRVLRPLIACLRRTAPV
jgi:transcriptional regulator with GAF, ATPase, and Fis domain